ncbi:FAD-binding oxidoreductase [Naasia sp. SYSU D00948]|uniref:FAD-binding oxidoreductase n=1 Tax=Naasia sp. SYSU D00948 TaxID=2817379 RepID=UPI001B308172|nr:FAD-binding oxidoreductase [Naasia sp. SYSU D00948]
MTLAPESPTSSVPLDELAASLTGRLHQPGTDDYRHLATPWNLAEETHAMAVVEAKTPEDVVATVRFGAAHGVEVGVRATGHGIINHLGNTILVHTGHFDEVTIHPDGWARIGAGVQWERVIDAAAEHGLAPLAGSSPGVGVVGYLTGGGIGPVARTYGVASDRVRAFEVVTGDGELRRVTALEHPDIFWALRGGKGALGIVTAVETELVHLRTLYGGAVYFAAEDIPNVVRTWGQWCPSLLEQATTSIAIQLLPEMPDVPPPLAGKLTVAVRFAWVGDPADGEREFAPMLAAGTPILGEIGEMPYTQLGMIHADPIDPLPFRENNALLREFSPETAEALLRVTGPDSGFLQIMAEVRQLGGAIARASDHSSAFVHRDAPYNVLLIGVPVGPEGEAVVANGDAIIDALSPWATGGGLPNFSPGMVAEEVARSYDDLTLRRLADLIEEYDPQHVIRAGRAIREALDLKS